MKRRRGPLSIGQKVMRGIPLTPAEEQLVGRRREIMAQALDEIGRGDYTTINKMREDAADMIRAERERRYVHPPSQEAKRRISRAMRVIASPAKRDHRGKFSR